MGAINIGTTVASQLDAGASILAAGHTADVRLVKARFAAFEGAHRVLGTAHEKVQAAQRAVKAEQARLTELDAAQRKAIDELAAALIVDGAPRRNPFARFGGHAPGALIALAADGEVKAVQQLVATVQRTKGVSKLSLQTAQAANKAAAALEQGVLRIDKLQDVLRDARHIRDAASQAWLAELGALKRGARAAADDGAPMLYATLFGRPGRSNGKAAKAAPAPTPAPAPAPAPAPTPAATPTV